MAVKVKPGCYLSVPTTPVDKFLKIAVAREEAGFDLLMPPIIFSSARNSSGSLVNASCDRHSNI
jgi:hypothetical protein